MVLYRLKSHQIYTRLDRIPMSSLWQSLRHLQSRLLSKTHRILRWPILRDVNSWSDCSDIPIYLLGDIEQLGKFPQYIVIYWYRDAIIRTPGCNVWKPVTPLYGFQIRTIKLSPKTSRLSPQDLRKKTIYIRWLLILKLKLSDYRKQ